MNANDTAHLLGFSLKQYPSLKFIVDTFLSAQLPEHWIEFVDDNNEIFYFHSLTLESTREHPLESLFRDFTASLLQDSNILNRLDYDALRIYLNETVMQYSFSHASISPHDVLKAAEDLAIDPSLEAPLLWIARDLLTDELPQGWSKVHGFGKTSRTTYKNSQGLVFLVHPFLDSYKEIVEQFRNCSSSFPFSFSDVNAGWMRFSDVAGVQEYYYNFITKKKSLSLPVAREWLINRPLIECDSIKSLSHAEVVFIKQAVKWGENVVMEKSFVPTLDSIRDIPLSSRRSARSNVSFSQESARKRVSLAKELYKIC
ncbi:hypothetical protein RCL1_006184 [Eukaryota sp. TZLM3-RCL]